MQLSAAPSPETQRLLASAALSGQFFQGNDRGFTGFPFLFLDDF